MNAYLLRFRLLPLLLVELEVGFCTSVRGNRVYLMLIHFAAV